MSSEQPLDDLVTVPNSWTVQRLIDCTEDKLISYGIVQPGSHFEDGVPILRVNNFRHGQLDLNEVLRVAPEVANKYKRTSLKGGEVLLTLVGSTGQSVVAPNELAGWNVPRAIAVIRPHKEIGSNWINICLQTGAAKHFLDVRANTTVQKTLNLKDVRDLPIVLPPKNLRHSIEEIETCINGKIQLNQQINQTLEQMAQAIFKSWFVDFEPVKAKIAALEAGGSEDDAQRAAMRAISGKNENELEQMQTDQPEQYAELHATAELFPSAMQDSELGEIPEGWEVGTLVDLADLNRSSWTKRTIPPEVEYVDLANTKNGAIESTTVYASDDAPSRARRKLSDGDTIVGTVRPGNRSFAFIQKSSENLTGSTGFAVLSPKDKVFSEFIYIAATSNESIDHLSHLADGGAYPAVRPEVVSRMVTVIPNNIILEHFHVLVSPYFEHSSNLKAESSLLAHTRDTLLPKLLSGELSIPEAEIQLADAEEAASV